MCKSPPFYSFIPICSILKGTFRLAAEHVLKTMRKGREPLLTLLEAFVYDPLVDWTTGMDAGYTGAFYGGEMGANARTGAMGKMKMEKDMTTSMFSIRLTEMNAAWASNKWVWNYVFSNTVEFPSWINPNLNFCVKLFLFRLCYSP